MDGINEESLEKFSDDQLDKVTRLAYFPTGAFGVHDFMIGRKLQGVLHIVISLFIFLFCNGFGEMICKSVGNCTNAGMINTFYTTISMMGTLFLIGSWVWAIIEGGKITKVASERNKTPKQKVREAKEIEEYKAKAPKRRREIQKFFSIISVVMGAIILAISLLFLSIEASMEYTPGGYQAYGMLSAMFMLPLLYAVEPILAILTLLFGVLGIGKKENQKIRLSPFLGILLGAIGMFLSWDIIYWHLIVKF